MNGATAPDLYRRKVHVMKCWIGYFQPVLDGEKPFEYRRDDRGGFEYADVLELHEYDQIQHVETGRVLRVPVIWVSDGDEPYAPCQPPAGMAILGLGRAQLVTS